MEKVKGFVDFVGEDARKREKIIEILRRNFNLYGFESAETPLIENVGFANLVNNNDDAVRDVFRLEDRGKRKLFLRHEFTFQLKRIAKNQKLPYRRYQIGYVFRDEPIRKGRLRQFIQCDADVVKSNIYDEIELLIMSKKIFDELKIKVNIFINSRKLLNEILELQGIKKSYQEEVIRIIDKIGRIEKSKLKKSLSKFSAEKIIDFFDKDEVFFHNYNSYSEIENILSSCKKFGVDLIFKPFLARGFSYYNGTIFEIWSDELEVSLAGGGSYLVNGIQSTGLSFGLEPIFLLARVDVSNESLVLVSLGKEEKALELAEKLRKNNFPVIILKDKSPTKAIEFANSKKIEKIIFLGDKEIEEGKCKIRNLKTGEEKILLLTEKKEI